MSNKEIEIMELIKNRYGADTTITIQDKFIVVSGMSDTKIGQVALRNIYKEVMGYFPSVLFNLINKIDKKHFGYLDIRNCRLSELN